MWDPAISRSKGTTTQQIKKSIAGRLGALMYLARVFRAAAREDVDACNPHETFLNARANCDPHETAEGHICVCEVAVVCVCVSELLVASSAKQLQASLTPDSKNPNIKISFFTF